jgi:hypothetical protein
MCLSHVIRHQHVSIAVATVITVTYKITRSPNGLSNCISEPLDVYKECLKLSTQPLNISLSTTKIR